MKKSRDMEYFLELLRSSSKRLPELDKKKLLSHILGRLPEELDSVEKSDFTLFATMN